MSAAAIEVGQREPVHPHAPENTSLKGFHSGKNLPITHAPIEIQRRHRTIRGVVEGPDGGELWEVGHYDLGTSDLHLDAAFQGLLGFRAYRV